jgi:NADH:ubiquinone oxidoreductase subunit 3 (subunit A)
MESSNADRRQKLAKYEASIREIESRQAELHASRTGYQRLFVAIAVVSALGFAWNKMLGAATLFTGVLMCAFGFYTVRVRLSDYRHELAGLREVAGQLRERESDE